MSDKLELEDQYSNWEIQKAVLSEARKDWKLYTIGILSMFAGVQANLTTPIFIRLIIDRVIVAKDVSNLFFYATMIVVISIMAGIFNYGNRYFNDKAAEETIFKLRNKLFDKIQKQSLKYLQEQETGQLMTRATADLNIIKNYLRREFRLGLDAVYYFVSISIIIYLTQPRFLIVIFILLPFLLVISWIYGRISRPLFRQRRQYFGDLSNKIQENIKAIETIRSFGQEEFEEKKFDENSQEYKDLYIKAEIVRGLTLPIATLLVSIGSVAVLYVGGFDIVSDIEGLGVVTLGMLVQFNLYLLQLVTPTRLLGNFIVGYTRTNVSGQRVFEILWSDNDIKESENAVFPENLEGRIEFVDVEFEYGDHQKILQHINLFIPKNSTLAIFGSTGSGKSTLINLIPRFFDPTKGEVLIDGLNIKQLKLEALRRQVATVSQDVFLFSKSIKENISFGRPDAEDQQIIDAAKAAKAHEFIVSFPDGYDTIIGERGITLSGGQKQRLTIARSILMNPKILILDDSTSSVDAETEFEIQEALENLLSNRTTIIITQKISSARFADKIIVIENGRITEEGSHDELLKLEGLYAKIYRTQKDPDLEEELLLLGGKTDE